MLTNYRPNGIEPAVSSFVVDSRDATPASVFVAFSGENVDGHDFMWATHSDAGQSLP
jgi:UDP-N-acetylmuramyl pentapeptide synthase